MITIRDFKKPEESALTRFVDSIMRAHRYNDPIFEQCYFKLTLKLEYAYVYFHRMYFESNFLRRQNQTYPTITDDLIVTFDISVAELLQYIGSVIPPVFRKRLDEINSIDVVYETIMMFLTDTTNRSTLKYNRDVFYKHIGLFDGVISYHVKTDHKRLDYILSKVNIKSDIPMSYIEASSENLASVLSNRDQNKDRYIQFTTSCATDTDVIKLSKFMRDTNLHICMLSRDGERLYLTLYATEFNDLLFKYIEFINNTVYVSL